MLQSIALQRVGHDRETEQQGDFPSGPVVKSFSFQRRG